MACHKGRSMPGLYWAPEFAGSHGSRLRDPRTEELAAQPFHACLHLSHFPGALGAGAP